MLTAVVVDTQDAPHRVELGALGPAMLALAGDEETVAAGLRRYAAAGATEVNVSLVGDGPTRERTLAVLRAAAASA